ncbi:DUF1345 domain-containing protein [Sphingomonas arantia]|uniref:DUF1345 domain-containing protein n=1 Tax=Sphingomonas arantia TaxID=1460676 RepID=A0ABW4TS40_9SPHN
MRGLDWMGRTVAPPRFVLFGVLAAVAVPVATLLFGWRLGMMAGFDVAGAAFLLSTVPLFGMRAGGMRATAKVNDANRAALLAITLLVMLVVLVSVAAELAQKGRPDSGTVWLILGTLALVWAFSNLVFALHYAHLFYLAGHDGRDRQGLRFPDTEEPDYGDFMYFSCTLGMTFQTSDVEIGARAMRRVVLFHSIAAFAFNLGVVAFTINVLGGG